MQLETIYIYYYHFYSFFKNSQQNFDVYFQHLEMDSLGSLIFLWLIWFIRVKFALWTIQDIFRLFKYRTVPMIVLVFMDLFVLFVEYKYHLSHYYYEVMLEVYNTLATNIKHEVIFTLFCTFQIEGQVFFLTKYTFYQVLHSV